MVAELNIDAERAAFEAWHQQHFGLPPHRAQIHHGGNKPGLEYWGDHTNQSWAGWQERARRATPSSSADELPLLPESKFCAWLHHGKVVNAFSHGVGDRASWDRDGYWSKKGYDRAPLYTAEQVQEAIAADRRARQGEPVECLRCEGRGHHAVMDDAAGRVVSGKCRECGGSGRAAIQAAAPADADSVPIPTHVNMARMMLALGYNWLKENAPEHLRAPAEDAREQKIAAQRSRMRERFANRSRTPATADFDLPAPNDNIDSVAARHTQPDRPIHSRCAGICQRCDELEAMLRRPSEDAREQQPDAEPSAASLAVILREIIVSAKAVRAWLIADRARNALHMLAAIESCRATGTDRAQAGEDA